LGLWLYPVLFLYAENTDSTSFVVALWPMLLALGLATIVWWLLRRTTGSWPRSALLASLGALLFYGFGHLHAALHILLLRGGVGFGQEWHAELKMKMWISVGLVVVFVGLFALAYWRSGKAKLETHLRLSSAANVLAGVLLLMPLATLAVGRLTSEQDPLEAADSAPLDAVSELVQRLGYKPDIYDIVLDGYARQDVLSEFYDFDNSDFLHFLEGKGFDVLDRSRSNYVWTFLSMASWLNMQYVNLFTTEIGEDSRDLTRPYLMIRDSGVARFLRQHGYRYVHLKSTWGATMMNMFADEEIDCGGGLFQNEFYRVLAESSLVRIWESPVGVDLAECHLSNLATLETMGSSPGPKFVFAHFLPPHHPYLFDRDGNVLSRATVSNQFELQRRLWGDREKFVDQTVYFNKRLKGVVEAILASSSNPPIILIHSDHGPQLLDDDEMEMLDVFWHGRFGVLNAVYLPGLAPGALPEDTALVNPFRRVLTLYFDADLIPLGRQFFASHYAKPYRFYEVRFDEEHPLGELEWSRELGPHPITTVATGRHPAAASMHE